MTRMASPRPTAGRPRGARKLPISLGSRLTKLANPRHYETAAAWCMAQLNNPAVPVDLQYRIAAALLPFERPRLEARIGKKEQLQEAAQSTPEAFLPGPTPGKVQ